MLTQERLKELVTYDPLTGVVSVKAHRHGMTRKVGDPIGSKTKTGYLESMLDQKVYTLHRLAFLYMEGSFPEGHIDHINRDKLDNRWCNLRAVTCAENAQNNIAPRKHGSLGFRGVYRRGSKFLAKIVVNKKQIHLGAFESLQEAANAYLMAKPIYHPTYE